MPPAETSIRSKPIPYSTVPHLPEMQNEDAFDYICCGNNCRCLQKAKHPQTPGNDPKSLEATQLYHVTLLRKILQRIKPRDAARCRPPALLSPLDARGWCRSRLFLRLTNSVRFRSSAPSETFGVYSSFWLCLKGPLCSQTLPCNQAEVPVHLTLRFPCTVQPSAVSACCHADPPQAPSMAYFLLRHLSELQNTFACALLVRRIVEDCLDDRRPSFLAIDAAILYLFLAWLRLRTLSSRSHVLRFQIHPYCSSCWLYNIIRIKINYSERG